MKKLFAAAICLFLMCSFCITYVSAAPSAEITANLSEPVQGTDGTQIFTLYISISSPSEPYASLDFDLISSSAEHLSIVDNSAEGDRSDLDVSFTSEYGGVYHKGRIDESSGAISYLIGVFSSTGGNAITGETDICTVRLRYSGVEEQTLSIENLKLVYITADGDVVSEKISGSLGLTVIGDITFNDHSTPLGSFPADTIKSDSDGNLLLYALLGGGILIVAGVIVLIVVKKRKGSPIVKQN